MTTGTPVGSGIISTPVKFDITQATPSSVYYGTGQGLPYSQYTLVWNNKDATLDDLGRFNEAIKCFYMVIETDSKEADAWVNKGVSIGLLGRFEEAIACFETALKINPLNACAWYNNGISKR